MRTFIPVAIVLPLILAAPSLAQSSAALLIKPWQEATAFEFASDIIVFDSGDLDAANRRGKDQKLEQWWYEAEGRVRFMPEQEHSPAVGFDILHIDLDHDRGRFPQRLVNYSVAIGVPLAEWNGWEIGATVGVGFGSDSPFSDDEGWYAKGDLIGSYKIDDDTGWQVFINYNGNRTFLPDLPLPGFAYYDRVDERFKYAIGFPYSSLTWTPTDRWTIGVRYALVYSFDVDVTYEIVDGWSVFGAFEGRHEAFHVEGKSDHERIFFTQRRIEGGIRWSPCANVGLTAAGGFAFDQEFQTGWDVRDLSNDRELDDAPYIRLGVDVRF